MTNESAGAPTSPSNGTLAAAREEISERADSVWTRGRGRAPGIAKHRKHALKGSGGRIAIVDGCRTPFTRAGAELAQMDVIDLATQTRLTTYGFLPLARPENRWGIGDPGQTPQQSC